LVRSSTTRTWTWGTGAPRQANLVTGAPGRSAAIACRAVAKRARSTVSTSSPDLSSGMLTTSVASARP
jgi:hypothetical protein